AMVEPGSTFKLVTAIAAVEQGKVEFHEKIETPESGKLLIHGQWMRDHDPLGMLTFPEVIMKSSNIATSKIAMRLSKDVFYQYTRNLGFGTPTGIDLPYEETGYLPKPYEWSQVTLAWMSIGYEVLITPIQLTQAYAAFANRGSMMRPYLVEKIVDSNGNIVWKHNNIEVRQIAEKSTLKRLYPIFKGVVSDSGTAAQAQVKGLSIAGKTGTAQKFIDGQYRTEYRSSFVGFFPADDPQYVCLVLLDDPDVYPPYGGWTAGPIFRQTAKRIAGLDDQIEKEIIENESNSKQWTYTPDVTNLTKKEAAALLQKQNLNYSMTGEGSWIVDQSPKAGAELSPGEKITLRLSSPKTLATTADIPANHSIIPDVIGMSMRKAILLINSRSFEVKTIGSGTVHKQFPDAGSIMEKGEAVLIRGRAKSLETIAGVE
ncbi:MAG TPA: penicillin-binding transpeptidase domain-containing protein, partial [Balneolaceae bacterium]|nr:penicillin-binding transpeptidase domain-containing protein [Balneolaceae bacterium]